MLWGIPSCSDLFTGKGLKEDHADLGTYWTWWFEHYGCPGL